MSRRLLQCLIQHIKGRILTAGHITACALLVKKALVELLNFPYKMIQVLMRRGDDILDCHTVEKSAVWVPMFYAYCRPDSNGRMLIALTSIVAVLFGGIHCAGWNFPFPSHAELIIWRVSSLIILVVPFTIALLGVEVDTIVTDLDEGDESFNLLKEIIGLITLLVILFGGVIYVLARLTLFVEAFIALRHLPTGAYAVVEWTALLLHM